LNALISGFENPFVEWMLVNVAARHNSGHCVTISRSISLGSLEGNSRKQISARLAARATSAGKEISMEAVLLAMIFLASSGALVHTALTPKPPTEATQVSVSDPAEVSVAVLRQNHEFGGNEGGAPLVDVAGNRLQADPQPRVIER
jgi:hypothetical protein